MIEALNHLTGAQVVWDDTRGINEHEATTLRPAEERSELGWTDPASEPQTDRRCH
jgi:hypothetical protein